MAVNNQESGRGSKSLFSLSVITSVSDLPDSAKLLAAVILDGVSTAQTVPLSVLYQKIPVSVNFPKKYYEISFYNDLATHIIEEENLIGNRLYTRNITRDLVLPQNFNGSRATLDSPASVTVAFPISYTTEISTTTTLGEVQFIPGAVEGVFPAVSPTPLPSGSQYLFSHPTCIGNAQGLAITLNHSASISGFEPGTPVSALTSDDLVSINASISTIQDDVSAIQTSIQSVKTSVDQVKASVSDLFVEAAALSIRINTVSALIGDVSGVPAITSAQADVSVLKLQRVSINNKISSVSASLNNRITATSAALDAQNSATSVLLQGNIDSLAASVSDLFVQDAALSSRIDGVSALLSGVSGVPAITSLRDLSSVHTQQLTSINNKISSVSVDFTTRFVSASTDYTSRISATSVVLASIIQDVSAYYDTSVIPFTGALLSISAAHENKTIYANRNGPIRLFFKGGFSKNGRTTNVIQANTNGPVSIVTSGVSGIVVQSRDDLYTTNGLWATMGIMQITSALAVATGDLI